MLYFVGGASRAGKTTIARDILGRHQIPYVSLDWLMMGFTNGIPEYGRVWDEQTGTMLHFAKKKASNFERRNALITAAIDGWSFCNALVFDQHILDDKTFRDFLLVRFKGNDEISKLVDATLQGMVYGAPQ